MERHGASCGPVPQLIESDPPLLVRVLPAGLLLSLELEELALHDLLATASGPPPARRGRRSRALKRGRARRASKAAAAVAAVTGHGGRSG